jgi:hypothetical protein
MTFLSLVFQFHLIAADSKPWYHFEKVLTEQLKESGDGIGSCQ